jgi:methionyl-tRNA formyltransferase
MTGMLRVGFFGQSGPFAPVALRELMTGRPPIALALVVEGVKPGSHGHRHELRAPEPSRAPGGEDLCGLAASLGSPALRTSDVNARRAVELIGEHDLDWIVCVGFDRLFTPAVLATARCGGVNAHPSPLPLLRGPSPIFWALKLGLTELSVALHALDPAEDHGPVYAVEHFALPPRAGGDAIYVLAGRLAGRMLASLLGRAGTGSLVGTPQDHSRATRAPRPRPEDVEVVPGDWQCEHLARFACGAPFFRAPWLRLGGETFFVRRGLCAEPGRRLPAQYVLQGSTLIVECRDGVVHLEIQS